MKHTLVSILLLSLACQGTQRSPLSKYDPEQHLTKVESQAFMASIIRYVGDLPRRTPDSLRLDSSYDDHYAQQVVQHHLIAFHREPDGLTSFLVKRRAPSIHDKFVAIGGRLRLDVDDNLTHFEEVFRTWKLPPAELEERALYLFDLMLQGSDLSPYYTASAGFNYIEFPDSNVYYDTAVRAWRSTQYGSVEQMVYQR